MVTQIGLQLAILLLPCCSEYWNNNACSKFCRCYCYILKLQGKKLLELVSSCLICGRTGVEWASPTLLKGVSTW